MPTWPSSLPQIANLPGYSEQPPGNLARSTVEGAPALARRRASDNIRIFSQPMVMTAAQLQTFDDFLQNDLAGGKLSFDWVNSRTGLSARLRLTERPAYEPITGDQAWRVSLSLIEIPT